MDNILIKESIDELEKKYGEKCDRFENTLTENQQEKFYKLETLIDSLSPEQKKTFFELMEISNQINTMA